MTEDSLERLKQLPGGSRGRNGTSGYLPTAMRELKAETLKAGKEIVREYRQVGTRNAGPTATNVRKGKVAGLLGFNADWAWEDDQQVLHFSYTGRWHGRGQGPEGMERGPFGYPDDYKHFKVPPEEGRPDGGS